MQNEEWINSFPNSPTQTGARAVMVCHPLLIEKVPTRKKCAFFFAQFVSIFGVA